MSPSHRSLGLFSVLSIVGLVVLALAPTGHAATAAPARQHATARPVAPRDLILGLDVSSHQGNVDWRAAAAHGARFAYVKATEGTGYVNGYFTQQYNGSYQAGLIRGAYHFALPNVSGGVDQADYFVDHGGGWSPDGRTLPPALDIEYNPYEGGTCYGYSQEGMSEWVRSFSDQVRRRTGRWPTIYTNADWWSRCTGNAGGFGPTNPLWVPSYTRAVGSLPCCWPQFTFWQFADSGVLPGDQDYFAGSYDDLRVLATVA